VLRAAALGGVAHAVHVSSVAVYARAPGPIDENTPIDTPLASSDVYARSKRESELAARGAADAGGVALTVLRPAAVYGEHDRLLSMRIARLVRRPITPVLGSGRNTLPVVYAGNVAAAIARCIDAPPTRSPRIFDLGLDYPLTQNELILGIARGLGARPRLVHLPGTPLRFAASLGERLGLSVPGAGDLRLTRFVRLALDDSPYGSSRIRAELDWMPAFGHEEGLARTAAWLRRA
jgi:nucleoside-diphosphate-sugar epimerase